MQQLESSRALSNSISSLATGVTTGQMQTRSAAYKSQHVIIPY